MLTNLILIPVLAKQLAIYSSSFTGNELTGFGPGGLGPPACRATII